MEFLTVPKPLVIIISVYRALVIYYLLDRHYTLMNSQKIEILYNVQCTWYRIQYIIPIIWVSQDQ